MKFKFNFNYNEIIGATSYEMNFNRTYRGWSIIFSVEEGMRTAACRKFDHF